MICQRHSAIKPGFKFRTSDSSIYSFLINYLILYQQQVLPPPPPPLLTTVLWPHHAKSWLIGKDSDAGRDWRQEEKGTTEDEMAGWHHWLDGRESQWTPGVGDGQGGLACCDSWGRNELDTTERLIWSDGEWRNGECWYFCPSQWPLHKHPVLSSGFSCMWLLSGLASPRACPL